VLARGFEPHHTGVWGRASTVGLPQREGGGLEPAYRSQNPRAYHDRPSM